MHVAPLWPPHGHAHVPHLGCCVGSLRMRGVCVAFRRRPAGPALRLAREQARGRVRRRRAGRLYARAHDRRHGFATGE
eukprot:365976-Chlamydomonas_euryale.AAC.5